jgi:hypothetical protein
MEPIVLHNFIHQKVSSLSTALANIFTGGALIYTFDRPRWVFVGSIPAQAAVLWHFVNKQELHIASSGCTFFTWNHITEVLVYTGLFRHAFAIGKLVVFVTFHIFDPIKFCSSIPVDQLHDSIEATLQETFKDHGDDFVSNKFLDSISVLFFALNDKYQKYGIGITNILPTRQSS